MNNIEHNGIHYEAREYEDGSVLEACKKCAFDKMESVCEKTNCMPHEREDGKNVFFVKV